ncbi:hypothetical protein Tco_0575991 [Tanacetum coccineum]
MRMVGKGFSGRETPIFPIMVVHNQEEMGEGSANPTDPHHTPTFIQPSTSQPQKKQKPRKPKRKDTQIPQSSGPTEHVADEAVYKELDDSLVRAATTASSLEAEQDSGNIIKTRSKATPNEAESSRDEESLGEDASKQGRINAIDVDEDITLVNDQDDADMFDVNTLTGDEVLAEQEVAAKDVNLTVDEVTLAQALAALKSVKPKVKANVVEEPSVPVSAASTKVSAATTTTTATIPTPRKGIVITELEELVKPKKKDLIRLDEGIASKLQAAFDKEERLAREKDEANIAVTEEWDDIQAKVEADFYKKKRNRPPTRAQQRNIMCTYLKNIEGWKPKSLKNKSFANIQELFEKAMKMDLKKAKAEVIEGSSKKACTELEQEVTKKQKVDDVQETVEVDDDQETTKIKELMEIVPDKEEVEIDAIPLVVKPPSIMYLSSVHCFNSFDKKDLENSVELGKAKHGLTRPDEGYERVLWGDLKSTFLKDATHADLYVGEYQVYGRIVKIISLHDDLEVTVAKCLELMLLAQSYNCSKIKTAERVSTVKREWIKIEEMIKIDWRSRLLT